MFRITVAALLFAFVQGKTTDNVSSRLMIHVSFESDYSVLRCSMTPFPLLDTATYVGQDGDDNPKRIDTLSG